MYNDETIMKVNELHSWSEVGGGNAADNDHVTYLCERN